jgi:hypothetical protein
MPILLATTVIEFGLLLAVILPDRDKANTKKPPDGLNI